MNYNGKTRYSPLKVCKKCGMDSGVRKISRSVPEYFVAECESCGFKTKKHKSMAHATREWNGR